MPYPIALLGLLIAQMSPAVGMMFTITSAGRFFYSNLKTTNIFFAIWLALCWALFSIKIIDHVTALNIALGAGISGYLMVFMINKDTETNTIFATLLIYNLLFIIFRQFFCHQYITNLYDTQTNDFLALIAQRYADNPEQASFLSEMVIISKLNYTAHIVGLWTAFMLLCLGTAYFFTFARTNDVVGIYLYQNRVWCIYSLILALLIIVFTKYDIFAKNYIIALSPLYLLQGFGVIGMKTHHFLRRISPILKVLLFILLMLNPYFWLIIVLIGIFDCWLDFRKINYAPQENLR